MITRKTLPAWIAFCSFAAPVHGAINVPGADGSDGVLNITANTVIDLGQAPTGTWDQWNAANAGKGVYDAAKWAVVFKYSSVNVASGATVTFKNHDSRAPVVWLVSGNVTIAGTVNLDGQNAQPPPLLANPGPGGFRGGAGSYETNPAGGAGFGPGGGFQQNGNAGQGGAYGTATSVATYGNPSLIPLIGGSGGSGDPEFVYSTPERLGGGGGGGGLLIATSGTVALTGEIVSKGGDGTNYTYINTGGGSGGGLRVVCDQLSGTGKLTANGGGGWQAGGLGRIRLERVTNSNSLTIVPDPSVVPLAASATALLWPPSDAPQVNVISIGGSAAPVDPRASFGSAGADVALPQTTSTQAIIETTNVEQASQVQVRVTPRAGANATVVNATVQSVVSTSPLVVRWSATLPVNVGYSGVQVKVVRP